MADAVEIGRATWELPDDPFAGNGMFKTGVAIAAGYAWEREHQHEGSRTLQEAAAGSAADDAALQKMLWALPKLPDGSATTIPVLADIAAAVLARPWRATAVLALASLLERQREVSGALARLLITSVVDGAPEYMELRQTTARSLSAIEHEAAHAVVAHEMGLRLTGVWIAESLQAQARAAREARERAAVAGVGSSARFASLRMFS